MDKERYAIEAIEAIENIMSLLSPTYSCITRLRNGNHQY